MPQQAPLSKNSPLMQGLSKLWDMYNSPNVQTMLDAGDMAARNTPVPYDDMAMAMVLAPRTLSKFQKTMSKNLKTLDKRSMNRRLKEALAFMQTRYPRYTERALSNVDNLVEDDITGYIADDKTLSINPHWSRTIKDLVNDFGHEMQHARQMNPNEPKFKNPSKALTPTYPYDEARNTLVDQVEASRVGDFDWMQRASTQYKNLPWEKEANWAGNTAEAAYNKYQSMLPWYQRLIDKFK